MNKPKRQRQNAPRTRQAAARPAEWLRDRPLIVWGGLAIYLTLFLLSPLSSAHQLDGAFRRFRLLHSLFLLDDLAQQWFAGLSWHSVSQRAEILSLAAALFAIWWVAGWIALRVSDLDRCLSRLESFVFAAGIGLNATSLLTLTLGLAGQLNRPAFTVVAAIVLVAAAVLRLRGTFLMAPRSAETESLAPSKPAYEVSGADDDSLQLSDRVLWLGAPFVLAIVLGAMLPPLDFDVREYHLQAPKEFYQAGQITFLSHNVYANMPLGTEMLSLQGMIAAGDWWTGALVGKTLVACFAPLGALALLAAGRRLATRSAGVLAAVCYLSIPWIALVSMQGLVEGAFAFYLFAAVYAALLWRQQANASLPANKFLALAGFLAGGAVSCKYPAVLLCVAPLAVWIAWQVWIKARSLSQAPARPAARSVAVFLLAISLGCGLWFAKNAVLTGNPTYPLLVSVFGGHTRTPEKDQQWTRAHGTPNFQAADLAGRLADVTLRSDWLSPLLVPLAILAFAAPGQRRLVWQLAAVCAFVFLAWWLFTHRLDRFWVPALGIVALLVGIGAVWTNRRWWQWTLAAWLAIGLLYNLCVITGGALGDNHYSADLERLRVDPQVIDPWHLYLNAHAADVTRVLLVGDAQPFDLEVPVLYNTVFDDSIFEALARDRTPEAVRAALAAANISHILVDWSEIRRYRSPGNYGITDFLEPEVFQRLVAAGVLSEVHGVGDQSTSQLFRVLATPQR